MLVQKVRVEGPCSAIVASNVKEARVRLKGTYTCTRGATHLFLPCHDGQRNIEPNPGQPAVVEDLADTSALESEVGSLITASRPGRSTGRPARG